MCKGKAVFSYLIGRSSVTGLHTTWFRNRSELIQTSFKGLYRTPFANIACQPLVVEHSQ